MTEVSDYLSSVARTHAELARQTNDPDEANGHALISVAYSLCDLSRVIAQYNSQFPPLAGHSVKA